MRALALRATEAADMTVAESEGNFATAARWIAALDEAAMPDELVLRVISGCRARPGAKLASYLSFYTPPVMRELARIEAATALAAAPAASAVAVSLAPPPVRPGPSEPAVDAPAIRAITCEAMGWARLKRPPRPAELGEVQEWRSRAAALNLTHPETMDLMRGVIELIAGREHDRGAIMPTSLHYFARPMRDALDAMARHRVAAAPGTGAPARSAAAEKGDAPPPIKGDTVSPDPSESLKRKESSSGGDSSGLTLTPACASARDLGAGSPPRSAAGEERWLENGSGGAVPLSLARTARLSRLLELN